ncbi:MAG: TolC family protein [Flavobacteriales bacterium]|nr:TolC family protein [Flavobacteriales bacterium]
MKRTLSIFFIYMCIPFFISAQHSLSLEQAQNYALQNSYENRMAVLDVESARSKVKETFAIGLPQINASGSFQHFLDIPVTVLPDFISPSVYSALVNEDLIPDDNVPEFGTFPAQFGTDYNVTGGIELQQLIFNGSYLIGLQATKAFVEVSKNQQEMTFAEVKQAVATAYYGVLVATENIRILQENRTTLTATLSDTRAYFEEGFVEEQDVEQLELTVSQLDAGIANAERQLANLNDLFKMQIGMPISENVTLSDSLETLLEKYSNTNLSSKNLVPNLHPNYKIAESNLNLWGLNVKNEKAKYLPSLSAFGSYSQSAQRLEFDFFDSGGEWFPSSLWGINLSVPIFSSGMKKNIVKQAQVEEDKAEIILTQVEQGLKMEYSNAYSNYLFSAEQYQIQKDNVALAKRIRDKTQIKYNEGISSSFEYNQMQSQYLQTESTYIETVLNFLNARSALDKASNNYE